MQDLIDRFLFKYIEKGSKIIIYGTDNVGQSFIIFSILKG